MPWWDLIVRAVLRLGIYYLAIGSRLTEPEVEAYLHEVYPGPSDLESPIDVLPEAEGVPPSEAH